MRTLFVSAALFLSACEPGVTIGNPDAGTQQQDAGTSSAQDAGPVVVGGCPRVLLGSSTDVTYAADTAALTNIVISQRLEWRDAPDDALEFTADTAGTYRFDLTSSNQNLSVSIESYTPRRTFTRADCGPSGVVVSIDGVYSEELQLAAGEKMVVFISAPYWAAMQTGPYSLRIHRLP